MQTLSVEKLHATNHYLDVIAKLNSHGSNILFLTTEEKDSHNVIHFQHKFPHSSLIFDEVMIYEKNTENLLSWKTSNIYVSVNIV
ncbi:hypothetical protein ACQKMV_05050 [Lysinibacillus sp. NPDC094403]|uniref:hypothetical protein n=1 Tax=Lysinibacillus sp. NPDC094403 TaxID=3390581 RepID=UPI003D06F0D0